MNVSGMQSRYVASGETVAVRPLVAADVNDRYLSWMNDEEVTRYLDSTGPYSLADLEAYFDRFGAAPDSLMFAIDARDTGLHIGNVKLEPIDRNGRSAVLGLMIGDKDYWGKGICEEASRLVVDYAFDALGLKKIELGVYANHSPALRCYEKVGFRVLRRYPRPSPKHGEKAEAMWMVVERELDQSGQRDGL